MSIEENRISDAGMLSSKDYLKLCDDTDFFNKKLDALKDMIHWRNEIFSEKEEKYQHFINFQIKKMEKDKEQYLKKTEELSVKIDESKAQLSELEANFSQLKLKHSQEKLLNEELKNKLEKLQLELKQKDEEFHQTSLNYSTVISWYEDFLNTVIDLDKENSKIASITFKDFKNLDGSPHVKVEIMDGSKFKVIEIQPLLNEDNILNKVIKKQELLLLLFRIQKHLNSN